MLRSISFQRVWPIVEKEFLQVIRERRTLAMILVMPVMQLLLLGYAVNQNIENIPMVVSDEVQDEQSRSFVQALERTRYFRITRYVDGAPEAQRSIDRGDAKVAVLIPPDFSRNLLAGRQASVQVLIDGSDPTTAQTALFTIDAVTQRTALTIAGALQERLGQRSRPPLIDLRPGVLYNPNMESTHFMIPGLIGLILQTQGVILTAFAIVRERERGTFEQLVVTPIQSWELLLGKVLPYVFIAFGQVGLALAVGVFWFGVPVRGNLMLLLMLSFVFLLCVLGMGLLVSTVAQTQTQAMQTAMFLLVPSLLLSGFVFPRESMPPVIASLGYAIPLTYFIRILRGVILKANGLAELWPNIVLLAIFAVGVFTVSALRFRKSLG